VRQAGPGRRLHNTIHPAVARRRTSTGSSEAWAPGLRAGGRGIPRLHSRARPAHPGVSEIRAAEGLASLVRRGRSRLYCWAQPPFSSPPPLREGAALTAAAWLISAWFYWNIATAVYRRAGLASAALYRAGLFPLRIGFVFIAAAFLLLAYLFFKTGLEALQEKGGVGQPSHVAPGGSVDHQQK
jgi:hypothetical protein